ncbi:MAG: putative xylanase/chitin deacetylase [Pseudarthrobacter sp.]|nr:putative xylanase/chitin deacetylase [Pseudarthrobacter sp.]
MRKLLAVLASMALVLTLGGFTRPSEFDRGLVSVTFDDGWTSQHKNALPILEKYGIPATLYIISGSINDQPAYMTQAQIQDFADRGHAIESHSVTHPHLPGLSPARLAAELEQSQSTLRRLFGPAAATGFASPYAEYNDATLAAIGEVYSTHRAYDDDGTDNSAFNTRANFNRYNLRVKFVDSSTPTATVQGWIDSAKATNAWLILAYHEVGESVGGDTYTTDTAVLDADMKAVRDSGLGIVTVADGAAEVLPQLSRNQQAPGNP